MQWREQVPERSGMCLTGSERHRWNMKIFVTGVCGQLGHDVVLNALARGHEVIGSDIAPEDGNAPASAAYTYIPLDITAEAEVHRIMQSVKPDKIVHCAAWTAVDAAEERENMEKVFAINADGTRNIAEAAREIDAGMMYISTDYVFDGQGTEPWQPDDRRYAPLNVYGQSKLAGEKAVSETLSRFYVVRIAWVFGTNGKNFIRTMLNVGKKHDVVRVVKDQIGTPTYTLDLARLLVDMLETERYGYYHATNAEETEGAYISWYDFACEIYRQAGMGTKVIPVTTEEYGLSRARRPFNSRLDKSKLTENGFEPLPSWKDALRRYLQEIGETVS